MPDRDFVTHAGRNGTTQPDGIAAAMSATISAYGQPTFHCAVCRGGEWIEDGETAIALHHLDCPRGKKGWNRDAR